MEPHMWAVTFWNDDVTTMDFVVTVLRTVFLKSNDEAVEKMLEVHHKGSAVVGEYTFDIALTRTRTALRMARGAGFPLRITYQRL